MKKRTTIYAILGVGTVVIIVLVLYFAGFRIAYDPTLLNDWNAISACASWASVIGSIFAIFVAIQIPSRIADKQDKIALFEKRFAFYEVLRQCISFSTMIRNSVTHEEIVAYFIAVFKRARPNGNSVDDREYEALLLREKVVDVLNQGIFLFEFDERKAVEKLISALTALLSISETHKNFWYFYGEYSNAVKMTKEKLLPKVEDALKFR